MWPPSGPCNARIFMTSAWVPPPHNHTFFPCNFQLKRACRFRACRLAFVLYDG